MSAPSGVLRSTALLAASQTVERVGSLAVALVLSRQEGAAALGVYVTVIAYFQLLALAGEMGVSNLLIREIAREPEATGRWVVHASALAGAVSVGVGALALAVTPHLGFDDQLRQGVMIVVLALFPAAAQAITHGVFVAHQRVHLEAAITTAANVTMVAASLWLLVLGRGVVSVVVAFAAVKALAAVLSITAVHVRIFRLRCSFDAAFARTLLREVRPFAGSSVIGGLFSRPEVILLSLLATPTQVGYFGAAFKVVDVWQLVPQAFMVNVYPLLSRAYRDGSTAVGEIERRATTTLLALGLPVSVGLAVLARPIVRVVFGDDFGPSVDLVRLLALTAVLYCVHSVLWRSLSARGDQSEVLRVQIVTLVLRVAVGLPVVAVAGAAGAAVLVPASFIVHNILLSAALRGRTGSIVDLAALAPFTAATAVFAGVAAFLVDAPLPLLVPVSLAAYLLPAWLLARNRTGSLWLRDSGALMTERSAT